MSFLYTSSRRVLSTVSACSISSVRSATLKWLSTPYSHVVGFPWVNGGNFTDRAARDCAAGPGIVWDAGMGVEVLLACTRSDVDPIKTINLVCTIPALENRSSEIRASSLKHGFIYQLTRENSKEDCENIELSENVQSDIEFTDGYPKDTGSEVYNNATVTSIMDNISCIATSVSPTTTIMTDRPAFATNTATTTTPPYCCYYYNYY
ncbi:uncharacterized protein [Macrobrachium rosenbergii]|uniref:uncharacterized protein n=1 Tax=Macrobrachium rosenbergii TaxID=79674 RepID=UPI0034D794AB